MCVVIAPRPDAWVCDIIAYGSKFTMLWVSNRLVLGGSVMHTVGRSAKVGPGLYTPLPTSPPPQFVLGPLVEVDTVSIS
jgi:hypothetical protein